MYDMPFKIIKCNHCRRLTILCEEKMELNYEWCCPYCKSDKYSSISSWDAATICDCFNFMVEYDCDGQPLHELTIIGKQRLKEMEREVK